MLFDTYQNEERIWLTTIGAKTSSGKYAFRGDLIVKQGTMNEAAKKRNPPEAIIKEGVILADDDKLLMVVGNFASVTELPDFIERFTPDLAGECRPVFYVDNLKENAVVEIDGRPYTLISFSSGMIWNEVLDLCYIEKADLKGQKTEDKVETVYEALKSFKPKFAQATLEEVIANRTENKREAWGAV